MELSRKKLSGSQTVNLHIEDEKEKEMQGMREEMKQIRLDQSRTNAMLMDLIELNSQGRNLKWIRPTQESTDQRLHSHS
jgi:hypothetical protein